MGSIFHKLDVTENTVGVPYNLQTVVSNFYVSLIGQRLAILPRPRSILWYLLFVNCWDEVTSLNHQMRLLHLCVPDITAPTLSLYARNSASMGRIDQSHAQKASGVTTSIQFEISRPRSCP